MEHHLRDRTVASWFWPLTILWLVAAVPAGLYVGRVATLTCSRATGQCEAVLRSAALWEAHEEFQLAGLDSAFLDITSNSSSGDWRERNQTHLPSLGLGYELGELRFVDPHCYILCEESIERAAADLNAFLEDPSRQSVELEFGEHYTAYAAILGLWVFAIVVFAALGLKRLKLALRPASGEPSQPGAPRGGGRLRYEVFSGFRSTAQGSFDFAPTDRVEARQGALHALRADGSSSLLVHYPARARHLARLAGRINAILARGS